MVVLCVRWRTRRACGARVTAGLGVEGARIGGTRRFGARFGALARVSRERLCFRFQRN